MSKLKEIADKLQQNVNESGTPRHLFRVYMTKVFWQQCMQEVCDKETVGTALDAEFYARQQIECVEVFAVDTEYTDHPPYSIVRFC